VHRPATSGQTIKAALIVASTIELGAIEALAGRRMHPEMGMLHERSVNDQEDGLGQRAGHGVGTPMRHSPAMHVPSVQSGLRRARRRLRAGVCSVSIRVGCG